MSLPPLAMPLLPGHGSGASTPSPAHGMPCDGTSGGLKATSMSPADDETATSATGLPGTICFGCTLLGEDAIGGPGPAVFLAETRTKYRLCASRCSKVTALT